MTAKTEKKNIFGNLAGWLQNTLVPLGEKLQSNNVIGAISETMQATMPLIIIGSFAVMFLCIDIGPYQKFLTSIPGATNVLGIINGMTSGAYSLWVVMLLSYFYGNKIGLKQNVVTVPITTAVFFILSAEISANSVGTNNLITAMLVGVLVPKAVKFLLEKNIRIRMPAGVPRFVEEGFATLIPALIICMISGVISGVFANTSYGTFTGLVYAILQAPLLKATASFWPYVLISCFASAIMWPGLHANTIMGVITPLVMANSTANMEAYMAGKALPNIIEFEFQMIGNPGGQASLLIPCVLGLLICRSKQIKQVSKVGIIPAIFGIGEPILFGLPCMFNPLMIIPMIVTTFWNYACWYVAISTGLVGKFTGVILPWTTPPFLNSALASTTPVSAVICHAVMLIVNALIWIPFIKAYDNQLLAQEAKTGNNSDN